MIEREPELPSASGTRRIRPPAGAPRPARAGRAPRVPFALLVTAMLLGGMGLLLALNTASAANELTRHSLAVRDDAVSAEVQQLRDEVAASAAPANLARAAQQLGMVPAGNPAFIVFGPNGSARVLGHAQAVTAAPLPLPTPDAPTHAASTSSAKASATASKTGTRSTSAASSRSAGRSNGATKPGAKPSAKPSPKPTPTPTPTPTYSLPGGPR